MFKAKKMCFLTSKYLKLYSNFPIFPLVFLFLFLIMLTNLVNVFDDCNSMKQDVIHLAQVNIQKKDIKDQMMYKTSLVDKSF